MNYLLPASADFDRNSSSYEDGKSVSREMIPQENKTKTFPLDKNIRKRMKTMLKELRDASDDSTDWVEGWKVGKNNIQVPKEFRQSIFNNYFYTSVIDDKHDNKEKEKGKEKNEEEYKYGEFECGCFTDYISDAIDHMADVGENFPSNVDDHANCNIKNEDGDPVHTYKTATYAKWKVADCIGGLKSLGVGLENGDKLFCHSCAQEYKRPSKLRLLIDDGSSSMLPNDLVNIILDYLAPPFTLVKYEDEFMETSAYIDWIEFLVYNLLEESQHWYINCNLDSKFYGYIMSWNQIDHHKLLIFDDIKGFETSFLQLL
jgi:hypothetical protein